MFVNVDLFASVGLKIGENLIISFSKFSSRRLFIEGNCDQFRVVSTALLKERALCLLRYKAICPRLLAKFYTVLPYNGIQFIGMAIVH